MKCVFMGTPDFSVAALEAIYNAGYEISACVTQPDKAKGRSKELQFSPVKEKALELGIKVLQPERARDESFIEELRAIKPDVIVVIAFGQILPEEIINMPDFGCINVHASLLPKYRGAAPIQYAVIDGLEYSGVTTMRMDVGLDTGDIIEVSKVKLEKKETGGSLFDRLSKVGAELIVHTLKLLESGEARYTPQNDADSSYVKMIKKSMGELDFTKTAAELERLIRGLNPWPSAYTHLNGKILKIWDADVIIDKTLVSGDAMPGQIVEIATDAFYIVTGDGLLKVNELQLEGKKRMDTASFLRGVKLDKGDILGES